MKKNLTLVLQTILAIFFSVSSFAQETTATLNGQVTDAKGTLVSGATVTVKHIPTGATAKTQTNNKGSFFVSNLQSGGPYSISFSYVGMKTEEKNDYNLSLGSNSLNIHLKDETSTLNEVVVRSRTGLRTGAGVQIGQSQIKNMPAISRNLQDITRLTPQSNNNSFGGTNFRYNNVTVDGAINNDAIGFSPSIGGQTAVSGQPGSSTRTAPFSLDAIQDVQVYLTPYDVKIGNFLGGSVNAVTRSGTNTLTGSFYAYGAGAQLIGPNNSGDKSSEPVSFSNAQTGIRLGFPIIKDKLFFFTNEEITRRVDPVVGGAGSVPNLITLDQAQKIDATMQAWGAGSAGAYGNTTKYSNSNKYFNRLDWIINDKNKLSLRNNTVTSEATSLERDGKTFRFGGVDYKQTNNHSSTVAELKTKISNTISNSAIIGYSAINDSRNPLSNPAIPQIEIAANNGGTIYLGTDREGSIFSMKQKTFEFTDNVTINKGNNTITLGTHNELYDITYGFVNSWNGRVAYDSVTDFLNNNPNRVRTNFAYVGNTRDNLLANPPAKFKVNMYSVYGEDEIRLGKLKLTPGLRFDMTVMPNKQPLGVKTQTAPVDVYYGQTYSYTTPSSIKNDFFGKIQVSPRIGFNYDLKGDQSVIIRGGTGVFIGRVPFAWLGYAYYNNGTTFGAYDNKRSSKAFTGLGVNGQYNPIKDALTGKGEANFAQEQGQNITDPNNAAAKTQVDMIDNNFKMPAAWRSSLAVDYTTQNKWKFTLEAMYTKVLEDVKFQQVNYIDTAHYMPYDVNKQQPIYSGKPIDSKFANAYLLSNTTEGYRYSLTAQASKVFDFGLTATAAYTFGHSKDIANGIRNSMESNWQLNPALSPNNPGLANSNFDIRNRIVTTFNYRKDWKNQGKYISNITLFFSAASGNPYTMGLMTAIDGTGQQTSLAYIPKKGETASFFASDVISQGQATAFDAYIDGNKYLSSRRGQFTERNAVTTPWNNQLDLRLSEDVNFKIADKTRTLTFTFDIINLSNLINSSWGYYYYSPDTFNSMSSIGLTVSKAGVPVSTTSAGSNPIYKWSDPGTQYAVDQFASRYQMQMGLRYTF